MASYIFGFCNKPSAQMVSFANETVELVHKGLDVMSVAVKRQVDAHHSLSTIHSRIQEREIHHSVCKGNKTFIEFSVKSSPKETNHYNLSLFISDRHSSIPLTTWICWFRNGSLKLISDFNCLKIGVRCFATKIHTPMPMPAVITFVVMKWGRFCSVISHLSHVNHHKRNAQFNLIYFQPAEYIYKWILMMCLIWACDDDSKHMSMLFLSPLSVSVLLTLTFRAKQQMSVIQEFSHSFCWTIIQIWKFVWWLVQLLNLALAIKMHYDRQLFPFTFQKIWFTKFVAVKWQTFVFRPNGKGSSIRS